MFYYDKDSLVRHVGGGIAKQENFLIFDCELNLSWCSGCQRFQHWGQVAC